MGANNVLFSCTSLLGTNKVGKLQKTDKGYYRMCVGALNMFNSAGHFYPYDKVRDMFLESGPLMRRVRRGALRGEYGHPRQNNLSDQAFAARVMDIDEKSVACHHMNLELDFENMKDENGRPVVGIMSEVAPNGPYGNVLREQLENPDENVCFSIRSFTRDTDVFGVRHREIKHIVTFDYVNEPGMSVAEKYKSPGLESYGPEKTISRATMEAVVQNSASMGIGQESVILSADELFRNLGWTTDKSLERLLRPQAPWAGW